MSRIDVPVKAYILGLLPQSDSGLAAPSFWSRAEVTQAFDDAGLIWRREAEIEFSPIDISERTEVVPDDENGMWAHFINHLSPQTRGIGVGFVYDLPSQEGGWGGGRVAVLSGRKAWSGLPGFAGNLLAHELGHVLTNSPFHSSDPSNLMYGSRNPRVANAGLLTEEQVTISRRRALTL